MQKCEGCLMLSLYIAIQEMKIFSLQISSEHLHQCIILRTQQAVYLNEKETKIVFCTAARQDIKMPRM